MIQRTNVIQTARPDYFSTTNDNNIPTSYYKQPFFVNNQSYTNKIIQNDSPLNSNHPEIFEFEIPGFKMNR